MNMTREYAINKMLEDVDYALKGMKKGGNRMTAFNSLNDLAWTARWLSVDVVNELLGPDFTPAKYPKCEED